MRSCATVMADILRFTSGGVEIRIPTRVNVINSVRICPDTKHIIITATDKPFPKPVYNATDDNKRIPEFMLR